MSDATTAAPDAAPSTDNAAAVPVAAPQAPTAAAPAAAEPVEATPPAAEPQADGTFSYAPTGSVSLDIALSFFGKQGIGPESPEAQAALRGDFSLLSAVLATKGDKATGWEQHVNLAQKALTDAAEAGKAKAAEVANIATAVTKEAGTDWATVQTWAKAAADPDEKAWFNSEIQKGGVAAKAAIAYVTNAYLKSNSSTIHPPSAADSNRGNGSANSSAGISAKEYAAGVAALYAKSGGRDVTRSPEYAALQNQRLLGKKLGK
jgi:hypothetical protein